MKHVLWSEIAEDLITRDWGIAAENLDAAAKNASADWLSVYLLADIAKSLRPLRCGNFIGIPAKLNTLAVEIRGLRRDLKTRRKRKK